jgi:predicted porin
MNKSLLPLCMLSVASIAHAQSSVSLSGTVDVAMTRTTGSLTSNTQMTSGGNSTSKFAIRGREDLGGGTSAGFWLESGFFADSGVFQTAPTITGGTMGDGGMIFGRRAIVTLGNDKYGELQMGRNWAPTYDAFTSRYDVMGVGVGIGLNYTASINPRFIRVSNSVGYVSPKVLGGLHANVQHWFGERPTGTGAGTAPGGDREGDGNGMRLTYEAGPLSVLAAYAHTDFSTGNGIQRQAAASYNFGFAKVTGNINRDQLGARKQNGFLVGVIVPVGVVDYKLSYSRLRTVSATSPVGSKIALGVVYNLSKRTALYASAAHISNKRGANFAISGSTTAANESSSGADIGLRHNF